MPTTEGISLENRLEKLQNLKKNVIGPISLSLAQYPQAKMLHEELNEKSIGKENGSSVVRIDAVTGHVCL